MNQSEVWNDFYSRNGRAWRGNTKIPFPNKGYALDLGCGNGKTVSTLLESDYSVTGVDFSEKAVESCRKEFPGCEFVVSSVTDMPFEDRSFDYITAVHVLENLDDGELGKTVSEIRRLVKPDGFVFIRCFTENDMRSESRTKSDIFYRYYTIENLTDAFSGFTVVESGLKEDRTRFGTIRSRIEILLKA